MFSSDGRTLQMTLVLRFAARSLYPVPLVMLSFSGGSASLLWSRMHVSDETCAHWFAASRPNCLKILQAGEWEYSRVLKTRNLLKNRDARNSENSEIASSWNVSGTRAFVVTPEFSIL
jgi:hypothetical protein